MRILRCKGFKPQPSSERGPELGSPARKSRCAGWIDDPVLLQTLVDEALEDPAAGVDCFNRPRRIWNAIAGTCFVGVSTNEPTLAYHCYPAVPLTALRSELARRARRTLADVLTAGQAP
jgi:hypothetical protein